MQFKSDNNESGELGSYELGEGHFLEGHFLEPRPDKHIVKSKMDELMERHAMADAAIESLKKGNKWDDDDMQEKCNPDDAPDFDKCIVTVEGLISGGKKLDEIMQSITSPPILNRQNTYMILDGKLVYNGNPDGSKMMKPDSRYDFEYGVWFPILE